MTLSKFPRLRGMNCSRSRPGGVHSTGDVGEPSAGMPEQCGTSDLEVDDELYAQVRGARDRWVLQELHPTNHLFRGH